MSINHREELKQCLEDCGLGGFYIEEEGELTLEGDLWRKTLRALGENRQILFHDIMGEGRVVEIPLKGVKIDGKETWIGMDHYEAGPYVRPHRDGWIHPWYRP